MRESNVDTDRLMPSLVYHGLAMAFITAAVLAIISTYGVFNHTYEESRHIACGIEWLDKGVYYRDELHPPLARIFVGLGPFIDGIRSTSEKDNYLEGNNLLQQKNAYRRSLTLARIGIIPFFVLSCFIVVGWTERLFGRLEALAALGGFVTLPPVLAHAGLAATDLANMALVLTGMYAWWRTLRQPTKKWRIMVGLISGFAIATHFSALVLLPAGYLVIFLLRNRRDGNGRPSGGNSFESVVLSLLIIAVVAFGILWAGYRFSWNSIDALESLEVNAIHRDPWIEDESPIFISKKFEAMKLPAPEFLMGLKELVYRLRRGYTPFILGKWFNPDGRWYFFPVALLVKTPLPFLLLVAFGGLTILGKAKRDRDRNALIPMCSVAVIVTLSMFSTINLGVRQILIFYPLAAMIAGMGLVRLWNLTGSRQNARIVAALLTAWQLIAVASVHPDHLAYFNELTRGRPEFFLRGSDLDWGQDLFRLSAKLKALKIDDAAIGYYGTIDPAKFDLPKFRVLRPFEPKSGWLAVSISNIKADAGYDWVEKYDPVALVGKSIRLYFIPRSDEQYFAKYAYQTMDAVAQTKNTLEGYLDLSFSNYQRGDYERAITAAKKGLELDPNSDEAYNNICAAHIKQRSWHRAIEFGEKAVALNPRNERAANNLALARSELTKSELQLQELRQKKASATDQTKEKSPSQ